jgi:TusA-related sulfurtransferase
MSERLTRFLDITGEVCPMTFVKTRLLIERMAPGEEAEIRLNGGEPLENVPASVTELGHSVLGIVREAGSPDPGIHRMRVRKKPADTK